MFALDDAYIDGNNGLPLQPRMEADNNQPPMTVGEFLLRTWMCSAPVEGANSKGKGAAN